MEKNVPINKGNYSLDTVERENLFSKNRAFGVEKDYYENRRQWEEYPKSFYVNDYPLLVDIELSSVCNLKCPFCFRACDSYKGNIDNSLMNFDLFKKIINEISGKVFAIRLSSRGESTLHPLFVDAIKYAKNKGIKEVSSLTNGSKLTLDFFESLMRAGLDWLTISFDGLYDEYEKNRYPLKYNEMYEKILNIKRFRDNEGFVKPVIKIQTIWPAIEKDPSMFYNKMVKVSDLVAFNPLVDYFSNDVPVNEVYIKNFACPQLYQRIIIGANGIAAMCTNDEMNKYVIGNANEQSIYDIWHGEKLNYMRQLHQLKDGFKQSELCKSCYLPRKTKENYSKVNDRKIIINNYV